MKQHLKQNVSNNEFISVFLHKLKYCENIMFLITNWVSDFDKVILSKIYLMLKFNKLISDARTQIWKLNFIELIHLKK